MLPLEHVGCALRLRKPPAPMAITGKDGQSLGVFKPSEPTYYRADTGHAAPGWFTEALEEGLAARGWTKNDTLHRLAGSIVDTLAEMYGRTQTNATARNRALPGWRRAIGGTR